MKKIFTILMAACFLLPVAIHAQGIYQLWGTARSGGVDDGGILFSAKYDGTGLAVKKVFDVQYAGDPGEHNKPVVFNNKLYTVMNAGGLGGRGIIAEFDPASNAWVKRADLMSIQSGGSTGSMIVYNNKLYGLAKSSYGVSKGSLFEFNPANNTLNSLYTFDCPESCEPRGSLAVYNNKFYGVASGGFFDHGQLFEFDLLTNIFTKKADFFEQVTGFVPQTPVVFNGKLYGVCTYGGANNGGTLYCYDPATNSFLKKADFNAIGFSDPTGRMLLYNNKLYGTTFRGPGFGPFGGIFEFDPANNGLTSKHEFDYESGHFAVELNVFNNRLFGSSRQGGINGAGTIFSFNPANSQFQKHVDLGNVKGAAASGSMTLYNNKFYGLTTDSAAYRRGGLFSFDPVDFTFNNLISFGGPQLTQPEGHLTLFNNKLYGTTSFGGTDQQGGLYSYDLRTGQYDPKINFTYLTGSPYLQGGVTLLNNKMYGVARDGGSAGRGVLYEYEPTTNNYTKKHDFTIATGSEPYAPLAVHNNKLYGSTASGSDDSDGNIFEFDPATGVYAQKVIMNNTRGSGLRGQLLWHNNRFYGTAFSGGVNGQGTVFEYNPVGNSFTKKADFDGAILSNSWGGLTELNGKLYGAAFNGGITDSGAIFEYNTASASIIKRADLDKANGKWVINRLASSHNKLVGLANRGGANDQGTLFSFDPVTGNYAKKTDFNTINGRIPHHNDLVSIPALVAPGSGGSCINTQTININAANANEWIPYTDAEGRAVAEINANGNILGNTAVRVFVNSDNIRQNNDGVFYLDRNITISSTNTPVTPVSVRLYILQSEFNSLKATAGSGIVVPADLVIYKNNDFCSAEMNAAALPLPTVKLDWGMDYVYSTEVTSFSSFYFAKLAGPLPVKILSFTGAVQPTLNQLTWKAVCTNDVDFIIERSVDGIHFDSIGINKAQQMYCDHPFKFNDAAPADISYYRVKMLEPSAVVSYSAIIVLERADSKDISLTLMPNPVTGNEMKIQIVAGNAQPLPVSLYDVQGRVVLQTILKVSKGTSLYNVPLRVSSGMYYLHYGAGKTVRVIKQ